MVLKYSDLLKIHKLVVLFRLGWVMACEFKSHLLNNVDIFHFIN